MQAAALAAASHAGFVALGYALRAAGVARAGDGAALLGLAAAVTLPALLLHTLPHALELAGDAPMLAALAAAGALHVLCLLVR